MDLARFCRRYPSLTALNPSFTAFDELLHIKFAYQGSIRYERTKGRLKAAAREKVFFFVFLLALTDCELPNRAFTPILW